MQQQLADLGEQESPTDKIRDDLSSWLHSQAQGLADSATGDRLASTRPPTALISLTMLSLEGLWHPSSDLEGPPLLTTEL